MDVNSIKQIYVFDDKINFEVTEDGLPIASKTTKDTRRVNFLCSKHNCRLISQEFLNGPTKLILTCPICERLDNYEPIRLSYKFEILKQKALSLLDKYRPEDIKLVRLDDFYVPELKVKNILKDDPKYFLSVDIKTDKDGGSIIVLYVGYKGKKEKAQFFVKPEKLQLSSDHKDLDPAKVLSKIEVTLRGRIITQKYD